MAKDGEKVQLRIGGHYHPQFNTYNPPPGTTVWLGAYNEEHIYTFELVKYQWFDSVVNAFFCKSTEMKRPMWVMNRKTAAKVFETHNIVGDRLWDSTRACVHYLLGLRVCYDDTMNENTIALVELDWQP